MSVASSNVIEDPQSPQSTRFTADKPTAVHLDDAGDLEKASPSASDPLEASFVWDLNIWLNIIALWMCFFTATWLLVVPSSIIGFISAAFPEDASIAIWIASSVTISNCVVQTFLGDISDHFGRKWPLLVGMALAVAGCLTAGRGSSMQMVIGGQVLNGLGLSMGYLAIPLSGEIVPKIHRAPVQAGSGIFAGIAYICGPIVAGGFIKHHVGGEGEGWRGPFYLSAGLAALTFVIVTLFYHPAPRPNPEKLSVKTRILKIDWMGVFLATAGVTLFLVGLESAGNPTPWVSGRVLACMVIGGLLIITFVIWEWRFTSHGLVDHSLFQNPNYAICLILHLVAGIVLFGGQAFLPQEIIELFTSDAVMTGVWNIPFNVMTICGGIISAVALHFTKEAKWTILAAYTLLLVGNCLMLVMRPKINYAAWFFPTMLMGTAVGIQTALLIIVVGISTPNHLIAAATTFAAAVRGLGGSIGTVVFSQIFRSKLLTFLPSEVAIKVLESGLPESSLPEFLDAFLAGEGASIIPSIPGVTPAILEAAEDGVAMAYTHAFKFVWYSLIPFAAISVIVCFWLQSTRAQLTLQVAAPVAKKQR
ncbi:hypothetical protein BDV12DRAFT_57007 [Aspergillus spectabilis]